MVTNELRTPNEPSWQDFFASARAALYADDVATALPMLEAVAHEQPRDPDVRIHLAWARARAAESQTRGAQQALEALARAVLARGAHPAVSLCILGYAALRRGDALMASRLFRRAARDAPELVDARRGRRAADRRLVASAPRPSATSRHTSHAHRSSSRSRWS